MKEKELNLSAGYNFTKNLNTNIMYVNVDADQANGETDYNNYFALFIKALPITLFSS